MRKFSITLLKLLLLSAFCLGLFSFNRSLAPMRSEVQKVYDDFLVELDKDIKLALTQQKTDLPQAATTINPNISIEFSIKEIDGRNNLKYELNWSDPTSLKKSLRLLDLLKTANAFSLPTIKNPEQAHIIIKVLGASGYKFESFLELAEVEKNSPLKLAIVLMRELVN